MVFGPFLGSQMFSVWIAVGGVAVWIALVAWAIGLAGGAKR
jgi:FtsH-binding integral membrane protein